MLNNDQYQISFNPPEANLQAGLLFRYIAACRVEVHFETQIEDLHR